MSEIFISYKREDEARVGRLVRALEGAGLSVWWDRNLPGGESWRSQIQNALNSAKCVIVVWTDQSVGQAGDFVRDEASAAKRRGALIPVLLDKVSPPLGFGELQAIDLTRWKGNSRDPFFQDLAAAVNAKLEGRPVPPAQGPAKRLLRRLTWSGFATALLFTVLAFGFNLFRAQDAVCRVPILQPRVSDLCGALGLGDLPTKQERTAWAGRQQGSCAALRTHIERFPSGIYRAEAATLLAARRMTQTEVWSPATKRLELFSPQDSAPSPNQAAAQAVAVAHAQSRAERLCAGFGATASFRLKSATPTPEEWHCSPLAKGVACGFEGKAVCQLDERLIQEHETCGN